MEAKASVEGLTGTISKTEEALLIRAPACLSSGNDINLCIVPTGYKKGKWGYVEKIVFSW